MQNVQPYQALQLEGSILHKWSSANHRDKEGIHQARSSPTSEHVCARKRQQRADWSQDPGTCVIYAHMARWHRREMCVRGAMIIISEVRDICQWLCGDCTEMMLPRINTRMRENGYDDTPYPSPIAAAACPDPSPVLCVAKCPQAFPAVG